MIFTDPGLAGVRAAAVWRALDPSDGWMPHAGNLVAVVPSITFDARRGIIFFADADGEQRLINLPGGITTESIVGLLQGLLTGLRAATPAPV